MYTYAKDLRDSIFPFSIDNKTLSLIIVNVLESIFFCTKNFPFFTHK